MTISPVSKEATKMFVEWAFQCKFEDDDPKVTRIRAFDLKSPQKSNQFLTTALCEEYQEWKGIATYKGADYRFFVRNVGEGDEPRVAYIIDPLTEVFDDSTGRPRANQDLIEMIAVSKGEAMPMVGNEEAALDVLDGLIEQGYEDFARSFKEQWLAWAKAQPAK
jgi:hypothetical protein